MDTKTNRSNVVRRGKRRTEPTHSKKDRHIVSRKSNGSSSSSSGKDSSAKSNIWQTLEEAKRKQDTIRNRVRTIGHDGEDGDYTEKGNNINIDYSEGDSAEYDDEFDSNVPISGGRTYSASNRGTHPALSNMQHPIQRYSLNSRKGEKSPVLTPEEAIRLVMERHSYISDSERTEDDHIFPRRKSSITKGSSSTNDTAMNTVASDSGHTRTSEGKRVLVLKKKKYREDTHPRTSKNRNYKANQHQEPQRRSLQQQQNIGIHQRKTDGDERPLGYSTSRAPAQTKNVQMKVKANHSNAVRSTRPAKPDVSRPLESLAPLRQQRPVERNEENDQSHRQRKQREEDAAKEHQNSLHRDQNIGVGVGVGGSDEVDEDDHNDREEKYTEKQSQVLKNLIEELKHSQKEKNKTSQQRAPLSVPENGLKNEKEIVLIAINDNDDFSSESDTDAYDDDFFGGNDDIVKRSSDRLNASNLVTDKEKESSVGEQEALEISLRGDDDEEEDWRGVSWKTAKTSRSGVSKYSKSSSVSLWMKTMGQGDSGSSQDDDIVFFDAIQEAEQPTSSRSGTSNESDKYESDTGGGWRGKITSFVGYTIGALSGSYDAEDDRGDDNDRVRTNSAASPRSNESKSPSRNPHISPRSPKAVVPSRELEIIRKCQEMAKKQQLAVKTREKEAARRNIEDIRLQRKEDAARAKVRREVMAYREMMEGMGKGEKLAPLDSKDAAQEYDDRLSMIKTLEDQEKKMKMHERNMMEMDGESKKKTNGKDPQGCGCACTIS